MYVIYSEFTSLKKVFLDVCVSTLSKRCSDSDSVVLKEKIILYYRGHKHKSAKYILKSKVQFN